MSKPKEVVAELLDGDGVGDFDLDSVPDELAEIGDLASLQFVDDDGRAFMWQPKKGRPAPVVLVADGVIIIHGPAIRSADFE